MSIYRIEDAQIVAIKRTTFESQGLKERGDLQKILKAQIGLLQIH